MEGIPPIGRYYNYDITNDAAHFRILQVCNNNISITLAFIASRESRQAIARATESEETVPSTACIEFL